MPDERENGRISYAEGLRRLAARAWHGADCASHARIGNHARCNCGHTADVALATQLAAVVERATEVVESAVAAASPWAFGDDAHLYEAVAILHALRAGYHPADSSAHPEGR